MNINFKIIKSIIKFLVAKSFLYFVEILSAAGQQQQDKQDCEVLVLHRIANDA